MVRVTYDIKTCDALTDSQLESLTLLYQPLFAFPALSLYMTLFYLSKNADSVDVKQLMRSLYIDHDQLTLLRKELEKFSLVRTFEDEGHLTLILQQPLSCKGFINHVTFGRLYAVVMGNEAFVEASQRYNNSLELIGTEISTGFDVSRLASWSSDDEDKMMAYTKVNEESSFDVDRFFATLNSIIFPNEMRTQALINLVERLGSEYNVSFRDMRSKLLAASNFETKSLDEHRFRVSIEKSGNHKSVNSVSDPYDLDSVSYLAHLQNHSYIADADLKLIQSLQKNIGLPDDVINVLIEYVLKNNHNNLSKNYVEKIATTWKRKGIDSKDKAKIEIQVPQKTQRTGVTTEIKMPEYSNDETIDEDVEVYKKKIEAFLKGGNT